MFSAKVRQRSTAKNANLWLLALLLIPMMALILGTAVPVAWADDDDDDEEIPFDEAMIFFELNDTDGDLGIHALIDGEAWKTLEIEDPRGREILDIKVKRSLRRQGLTEIFFESAEPTFDELDPEDFFRRFPEGEYEIEGKTIDGEELESEVYVSHVMPAPPANVMVDGEEAAEDCDADLPVVSGDVTISWDEVTESHPEIGIPGEEIEVDLYELVIENLESELSLTVELEDTEFEVPAAFIAPGDTIKFEILVHADNGNKTAVESCFIVGTP